VRGVLSPPLGLSLDALSAALSTHWRITAPLTYAPVGFGSHHWSAGSSFVTVDETASHDSLCAVLDAVRALPFDFVVAPVSTVDGASAVRVGGRFTVAVYPLVVGESFDWGRWADDAHRAAVCDMLVALHSAPVAGPLPVDDLVVPFRDGLHPGGFPAAGPYAARTARLLADHEPTVRRLLARYDALVAAVPSGHPTVFTHGEPHPGNTMRTAQGWRLVDWDTARVAPPERDLWLLEDPSLYAAYTAATGLPVSADVLELYRQRWDVADLAACVDRFRRPHVGDADDVQTWVILERLLRTA
jgi:hypothetical protein